MATIVTFTQRFPTSPPSAPLDRVVPETARIGFVAILSQMVQRRYVGWSVLVPEAFRTGRRQASDFGALPDDYLCSAALRDMSWDKFYVYCERVFRILSSELRGEYETEEVLGYYTSELNELLAEENLAYEFVDGVFQRRGHPQTEKAYHRAGAVLANPAYLVVRNHYVKARKFFDQRPSPDVENCIKEAVCALEAFAAIQLSPSTAREFDYIIRSKQGTQPDQIPSTIADGIIKLHAYRGNAQGVAHAALAGSSASLVEAELVLSVVASYITYMYDKFPLEKEDVPF